MVSYFFFNFIHLILIHCLSACFCNQHPVNFLLHCFLCIFIEMITDNIDFLPDFLCKCVPLCFCIHHFFFQVVSPKGLQRSCLKALSPLRVVPSTIWRNAISLGNGCRPLHSWLIPSIFNIFCYPRPVH